MPLARRALLTLLSGSAALLAAPAVAQTASPRRSGGELTFLIGSLDSGWGLNEKVDSYTGIVWGQLADKIVHVDDKGEATPWIAERWEENAGQSEFILHLRAGPSFADGSPVDARAVAANIELWARGDTSRGVGRLGLFPSSTYKGSEVLDDRRVRVSFTRPTLSFIPTLGYHKTVLRSLASLNLKAEELGNLDRQIGSGPFTLQSWLEGDHVVLRRRPDYNWGPQALAHQGPASLERITFKVVKDAAIRAAALQAGQAQIALNIAPHELRPLKARGIRAVAPDSLGFVSGFSVNTRAPFFDDVRLRQALQHAIDRQEILDTVFTEDWKPVTTLLQPNVPEAADLSALLAYDPEKSNRLLEEAGWQRGADGIRARGSDKLRFNLFASPWVGTSKQVDEVIVQQLQKVGIAARLQVVDIATFNARVRNNDSVPLREISRSFLDAGVVGNVLTDADRGDNWFKLGQSNETLNRLAQDIATAVDRRSRAETLKEAQRYVLEQGLFIPTAQLNQRLYVQAGTVKGEAYSGGGYALYHGAWLDA
ncbi:peptide ABC transporter substrate-binding protein [Pseudoroseomonas deserti]|uniref:Peptide ABC transporter substrate-binding protein n=1 Tax=Teichococcus deserti TaxID=1817963 RepID=A0A1V2H796_9PROT|nr:ABC transporter substrate-binding protein [Pseudoroseomonas deserti]ONG57343.1 peptide ABC transporter substrate-binding protein [Pseudoroseomonas deserti]